MSQGKKKDKTSPARIHVEGGIHAGRDVVQGDQYNLAPRDFQFANVATPAEFTEKLAEIQNAVATLKQQSDLSSAQTRNIEAAEEQIAIAKVEAEKPDADESKITTTLTEAKETFELLSGSIASATGLGVVLGNVIALAIQVFGG